MRKLSAYIAGALGRPLPRAVAERAKLHLLDTLAAMVSGSLLLPGRRAGAYVKTLGGTREASVAGTRLVTTAVNAALANGIFAHADETDDAETALRWLAAQTGGTFQADNRPRTPGDRGQNVGFDRLLARATSTLHQMYTLGFRPAPAPVRAHTIDVVSANPDVKLHVRAGYTDK